jgi:hypothetical protein
MESLCPHGRSVWPNRSRIFTQRTDPNCFSVGMISFAMVNVDPPLLILLVLSTILGIFQTVMKTTRLDVRQWLICTAVALSIVAAAEIRKAVRRRTAAT